MGYKQNEYIKSGKTNTVLKTFFVDCINMDLLVIPE